VRCCVEICACFWRELVRSLSGLFGRVYLGDVCAEL